MNKNTLNSNGQTKIIIGIGFCKQQVKLLEQKRINGINGNDNAILAMFI